MPLPLVRFHYQQQIHWGLRDGDTVRPLALPCTTTAELLALGQAHIATLATQADASLPLQEVELLSPITRDANVFCQGANYRQHMIDSGMNPDAKQFNMFFTKSSASISDPVGRIVRPAHVSLLDYEIELTLVLGRRTDHPVTVTDENLHEYVAGICIGNDVSARDIQIPQMQFHKGKSYRTFCPLGPVLCLLTREDMHYLDRLQLTLTVNGERRQHDSTANLVFKPAETLTEYSQIQNFKPGDVLMTGTPSGCALGLPSPALIRLTGLLPEARKWALFRKSQQRRTQYLTPGDRIVSTIVSDDGVIHLGTQQHTVAEETS